MKEDQMLALFGRLSYTVLSSRRVRLFCRTTFFHPVVFVCSVVQRTFIPSCPSVLSYNVQSSRRVRLFCRTTFNHPVVSVCSVVQRSFVPSCPSVLSYNVLSSRRVCLFCRTTFFHPVYRAGDRGRRRETGGFVAEEGRGHHERVCGCAATTLLTDAQRHLLGEEFHDHLPRSHQPNELFHQQPVLGCGDRAPLTGVTVWVFCKQFEFVIRRVNNRRVARHKIFNQSEDDCGWDNYPDC